MSSNIDRPKRLVTLRRDDTDFVISFYPEDTIMFRHVEPFSLRRVCEGASLEDHKRRLQCERYNSCRVLERPVLT